MKRENLTNKIFGNWTVESYAGNCKWNCVCTCGTKRTVSTQALKEGRSTNCGCKRCDDLTGQRFGRLIVMERSATIGKKTMWKCRCDCGNIIKVDGYNLRKRITQSCGCLSNDMKSIRATTHGLSNKRLYGVWQNIINRCTNPKSQEYRYYGERGITICDEWRNDFKVFYDWAMANGYDETAPKGQCTIDRIDNNKGYFPDNCHWISTKMNCRNTRKNRIVEFNGEKHTLSEWSEIIHIPSNTLTERLKRGWSIEKTLTTPAKKCGKAVYGQGDKNL